jgi:hypothetical protein
MFFNDVFTFEVEAKKANISLGSLLEKHTKMVEKGFIDSFYVLENSSNMVVLKVSAKVDRLTYLNTTSLNLEIGNIKD